MADDAAHITPRPGSRGKAIDIDDEAPPDASIREMEAAMGRPSFARFGGTVGADVELIGHHAGPTAGLGMREPVLVAAGASPAAADDVVFDSTTSDDTSAAEPLRQLVDDSPQWSFQRIDAVDEAPFPAPPDRSQGELPFSPPPVAPSPPTRPMPLFGPVGRPRSALLVGLLSVLTLGVYPLVWHHRINRELEDFDPKLHARPARSMLALLIPWLIGLLVSMAGAALIIIDRLHVQLPFDPHVTGTQAYYLLAGLGAVPYLILLLPFSVVAVVMTLERLRCAEEHVGATTDRQVRPVATALLLAIPVIGGLILVALEQRRLNAIWQAVAPAGQLYR